MARLSTTELLQAFIELEERHGFFALTARGVPYWHVVRHDVFREVLESLGLVERAHLRLEELPRRELLRSIQPRHIPASLRRSLWTGVGRADLLVQNHPRHVLHAGRFICPYSQPLLWDLPRTRLVLEGHFQGRYFHPPAEEQIRYVDLSLVRAHAHFRWHELRGRGLSGRELSAVRGVVRELERGLGGAPQYRAVLRRVRTAVLAHLGLTPCYERLLDRVQPKLIVNVIGYRLVNMVLTRVARRRGIPIAELQHGMLGPAHPAYNFAPGRNPDAFPDYLLLFGALWREMTPGLPLPPERTPAIGYAWLDLRRATVPRPSERGRRKILFLSQRAVGRELSRMAVELSRRLSREAFHLTYRLHPSESAGWQAHYPELAHSGIEVETPKQRDLYASQTAAHAQVGVYSTALLEGLAFGVPTFVVKLPGHEQIDTPAERGLLTKVADAEDLAEAVCSTEARVAPARIDELWSRNATAAFARFVERMVDPHRIGAQ